jgi:2C-methyl-D-erythritol 2,4-cyclodiphosphate synthase
MTIKTGIGQDSHAFEKTPGKPLILAGITINDETDLRHYCRLALFRH